MVNQSFAPIDTLQALEEALRTHDWGFEWSDDFRVWSAGNQQLNRMVAGTNRLKSQDAETADAVKKLWKKYRPAKM